MNILVEISTKDRDSTLGRCLAALLWQTRQDFDLLLINDGDKPLGETQTTEFFLAQHRRLRTVYEREGSHISQTHNHNVALYDLDFLHYDAILRLDDDVLLNREAIDRMVKAMIETGAAAVGGMLFEMEYITPELHDRAYMDDFETNPSTTGNVGAINSNWQQRVYPPTDRRFEVEHIYSTLLYDATAMRWAGGWPEAVYTPGVVHGEETDGTYRLHLSGGRLIVDTTITGQHLRAPGGIRSVRNYGQAQAHDLAKWQARLPRLREIDFGHVTVAVESRHCYGFGGAERLFYHTIHLLQSTQSASGLEVYPSFHNLHFSPEECQRTFGFSYEDKEPLEEYDVCIVIGHEPLCYTNAKKYIFYNLFPVEVDRAKLRQFSAIVGISLYTCEHIAEYWKLRAKLVYPAVEVVAPGEILEREDVILVVGRCVPHKGILWLMQKFVEMELSGWKLRVVAPATTRDYQAYEQQCIAYAKAHAGVIEMYRNISQADLAKLYATSQILWSAVGMTDGAPVSAEHFGYTPIEAMQSGCVPIVFDRGGHRETVSKQLRWSNEHELEDITRRVVSGDVVPPYQTEFEPWLPGNFVYHWSHLIRRVHALALELDPVVDLVVKDRPIRVACISDSPRLTTGFGVVAQQIYRRMAVERDLELCVYGMMDTTRRRPGEDMPWHFYESPAGDLQAKQRGTIPAFIQWAEPDVIFEIYEPGGAWDHVMIMRTLGIDQPKILYFPLEGVPMSKGAFNTLRLWDYPVTWCRAGWEYIRSVAPDVNIQYVYLGLDHAPFAPLESAERSRLRKLVGWDGKFVVMSVGSNKRNKQQPYLLDAVRQLLLEGHDDVYLYLHTLKYDNSVMQGWDLEWMWHMMIRELAATEEEFSALASHVLFPMDFHKWHGPAYRYTDDRAWSGLTTPATPQMRGAIFNAMDLITRYQLADLYVDVSSVEGWNMPPLEALACGTPAISVDDGLARTEVHARYCQGMMRPAHWDTWHTGARLLLIDPDDVRDGILEAKSNIDLLRLEAIEGGKRALNDLRWDKAGVFFADLARKAHAKRV